MTTSTPRRRPATGRPSDGTPVPALPGDDVPPQEPDVRAASAARRCDGGTGGTAGWCSPVPTSRTDRRRRRDRVAGTASGDRAQTRHRPARGERGREGVAARGVRGGRLPTTYEGFGLVPFEAADAGRAMPVRADHLTRRDPPGGRGAARPWDEDASADRVHRRPADPAAAAGTGRARARPRPRATPGTRRPQASLDAYDAALSLPASEMLRLEEPSSPGTRATGTSGTRSGRPASRSWSPISSCSPRRPAHARRAVPPAAHAQGPVRRTPRSCGASSGAATASLYAAEPDATGTPVDDEPERLFPENPPGY